MSILIPPENVSCSNQSEGCHGEHSLEITGLLATLVVKTGNLKFEAEFA